MYRTRILRFYEIRIARKPVCRRFKLACNCSDHSSPSPTSIDLQLSALHLREIVSTVASILSKATTIVDKFEDARTTVLQQRDVSGKSTAALEQNFIRECIS